MTKKSFAVAALLLGILAVLLIAPLPSSANRGVYSLDHGGSTIAIAGNGAITVVPTSGKGTAFSSGTVNFTGATVSGLTAAELPTALNSVTFATGKTVGLTDADSLTVSSKIIPQNLEINLGGIGASSASGDQVFIANRAYQVTAVRATWSHVGGSSAAATIEKLTGTTAPGSGTAMLTAAFDLTSTANTVGSGTLSGTVGNLQLAAGDRLGVKLSGTLTALTGLNITVQLKAI